MDIDWSQIAQSAVAILVPLTPYLQKGVEEIAKQIGKDTWEKGKAIYNSIRNRFKEEEDQADLNTLELFLQRPEIYEEALSRLLQQKAQKDPQFGKELHSLVQQAINTRSVVSYLNNFYGDVEKVIQIQSVGQLDIH